jgi:hypothetical protein
MVTLPLGGPAIVAVTERSYHNAISQEIKLATRGSTPGENAIYVAFFTAADLPDGDGVAGNLLKQPGLGDEVVAREMEERFPGVAMTPSAVFVQNRYGPFSYAFGRGTGGEACLYAWQRLMPADSLFRPKSGHHHCLGQGGLMPVQHVAAAMDMDEQALRVPGWDGLGCDAVYRHAANRSLLDFDVQPLRHGRDLRRYAGTEGVRKLFPALRRRRRGVPAAAQRLGDDSLEFGTDRVGNRNRLRGLLARSQGRLRHSGGHYQDQGCSGECAGGLHKVHENLTLAVPCSHYSALGASLNWTIRPRKHARASLGGRSRTCWT